jgi:hypothetical protein
LRPAGAAISQRVTDQIGEIERMGRLRRFLPPQVPDLIVASGNEMLAVKGRHVFGQLARRQVEKRTCSKFAYPFGWYWRWRTSSP